MNEMNGMSEWANEMHCNATVWALGQSGWRREEQAPASRNVGKTQGPR